MSGICSRGPGKLQPEPLSKCLEPGAFEVQGKSLFQKAFEECEGVVEEFSTHR